MVLDARQDWLVVHVDPAASRPWEQEPYFSYLTEMAARNIARGASVLVMERGRTIIILPDRGVDLGVVAPEDRIVVNKVMTGAGPAWHARVIAGEGNSLQ
jgi:hypothetical protein